MAPPHVGTDFNDLYDPSPARLTLRSADLPAATSAATDQARFEALKAEAKEIEERMRTCSREAKVLAEKIARWREAFEREGSGQVPEMEVLGSDDTKDVDGKSGKEQEDGIGGEEAFAAEDEKIDGGSSDDGERGRSRMTPRPSADEKSKERLEDGSSNKLASTQLPQDSRAGLLHEEDPSTKETERLRKAFRETVRLEKDRLSHHLGKQGYRLKRDQSNCSEASETTDDIYGLCQEDSIRSARTCPKILTALQEDAKEDPDLFEKLGEDEMLEHQIETRNATGKKLCVDYYIKRDCRANGRCPFDHNPINLRIRDELGSEVRDEPYPKGARCCDTDCYYKHAIEDWGGCWRRRDEAEKAAELELQIFEVEEKLKQVRDEACKEEALSDPEKFQSIFDQAFEGDDVDALLTFWRWSDPRVAAKLKEKGVNNLYERMAQTLSKSRDDCHRLAKFQKAAQEDQWLDWILCENGLPVLGLNRGPQAAHARIGQSPLAVLQSKARSDRDLATRLRKAGIAEDNIDANREAKIDKARGCSRTRTELQLKARVDHILADRVRREGLVEEEDASVGEAWPWAALSRKARTSMSGVTRSQSRAFAAKAEDERIKERISEARRSPWSLAALQMEARTNFKLAERLQWRGMAEVPERRSTSTAIIPRPCVNYHVRGNCSLGSTCRYSHAELADWVQDDLRIRVEDHESDKCNARTCLFDHSRTLRYRQDP